MRCRWLHGITRSRSVFSQIRGPGFSKRWVAPASSAQRKAIQSMPECAHRLRPVSQRPVAGLCRSGAALPAMPDRAEISHGQLDVRAARGSRCHRATRRKFELMGTANWRVGIMGRDP